MTPALHPRAVVAEIAAGIARRAGVTNPGTIRRAGRSAGLSDEAAAALPALVATIRGRQERQYRRDPLAVACLTRAHRLEMARERARDAARDRAAAETRASLLRAARVARALGYHVEASRRDGRVSSYYCTARDGQRGAALRISDHEIPSSSRREAEAYDRGTFYSGYPGAELLIEGQRVIRHAIRTPFSG